MLSLQDKNAEKDEELIKKMNDALNGVAAEPAAGAGGEAGAAGAPAAAASGATPAGAPLACPRAQQRSHQQRVRLLLLQLLPRWLLLPRPLERIRRRQRLQLQRLRQLPPASCRLSSWPPPWLALLPETTEARLAPVARARRWKRSPRRKP